jgi:hypothetical protein
VRSMARMVAVPPALEPIKRVLLEKMNMKMEI